MTHSCPTRRSSDLDGRVTIVRATRTVTIASIGAGFGRGAADTGSMMNALEYQSGFGNEFASEALPGALPAGQNRSEARRVGKSVSVRVDLGGRRIIKKKRKEVKLDDRISKQQE